MQIQEIDFKKHIPVEIVEATIAKCFKKVEHEESLHLEAQYTCPECGKDGESTAPYKRKSFKGVQAYVVDCQHCNTQIPITKKLKNIKKKDKKNK